MHKMYSLPISLWNIPHVNISTYNLTTAQAQSLTLGAISGWLNQILSPSGRAVLLGSHMCKRYSCLHSRINMCNSDFVSGLNKF